MGQEGVRLTLLELERLGIAARLGERFVSARLGGGRARFEILELFGDGGALVRRVEELGPGPTNANRVIVERAHWPGIARVR